MYLDSDSSESGDFATHSPSPPPPSNNDDISSQIIVESTPNSSPENSTRLPLQSITQDAVLEHYVLTRAIDHRNGISEDYRGITPRGEARMPTITCFIQFIFERSYWDLVTETKN